MQIFDIKELGAIGDGVTLETDVIQSAIDKLNTGDTLRFTKGSYVTGTLRLKSDITVVIDRDAEICASRNISHYADTGFYHNEFHETVSLIYALGCENITLTGGGRIQLSGDAFVDFATPRLDGMPKSSITREDVEQAVVMRRARPTQPIFFGNCKNVRIENVFILNSPCWTVTFASCDGVAIENVYIDNHTRIPNNDGLHFSASKNVSVRHSTLLCGDDCIATTCITDREGIAENVEISDCLLSSRSAAIRFGHLYSKVRRATVRNVNIINSNRGIAIFAMDEGYVKDVSFENVKANVKIYSGLWWGKGEGFVICADNSSGEISDISFKNCHFTEENPSVIASKDGNVKNILIESTSFAKQDGPSNEFYKGKLELAPNAPALEEKNFPKDMTLYVSGECKDLNII